MSSFIYTVLIANVRVSSESENMRGYCSVADSPHSPDERAACLSLV